MRLKDLMPVVCLLAAAVAPAAAQNTAQCATLSSGTYSQNFDSLASSGTANVWTDNSTIPFWYSTRTVYIAERALGSVASGTTGTVDYGICLSNNTANTVTALTVSFTGEEWRNGGNTSAQSLTFAYQVTGSQTPSVTNGTWTSYTSLNFATPTVGAA